MNIHQFAVEDWWISDYQAYNNKTLATISIDCIEDSELLVLSGKTKKSFCEMYTVADFFGKNQY
jgi:hypothetical protein